MARVSGSFRDPSGFLFERDGSLFRQVNLPYRSEYDQLSRPGGLFERLHAEGLLVAHQEVETAPEQASSAYKIIRPEPVPFVSYPYEWSFSQLKDAALLTLKTQRRALDHDFILKDSSAYNVQFFGATPIFIDTLSFAAYQEGQPWAGYRQFCQHFLGPLALASLRDIRLTQLMRSAIDGVPIDLTSRLLPRHSWLRFGLLSHIHLHARSQARHSSSDEASVSRARTANLTRFRLLALIDNLESTIRGLNWDPGMTEWGSYYEATNYSTRAFEEKERLVREFASIVRPSVLWDFGANTGHFTGVALDGLANLDPAVETYGVAFDIDPLAVEKNYLRCRSDRRTNMIPLVLDLTNPSPAIGWSNDERYDIRARGPADLGMALALVHHLSIGNNVPFSHISEFFAARCRRLIIEFVPKSDSQVQRLLSSRSDVFDEYTQERFEQAFRQHFHLARAERIDGSERVLYLMTPPGADC